MILCGIDPGLHGAVAFLYDDHAEVYSIPIEEVDTGKKTKKGKPKIKEVYKEQELLSLLSKVKPDFVMIESQHYRPKDHAYILSKLMYGYALVKGICMGLGYDVRTITSAAWKKKIGLPTGATKENSLVLAWELFPNLSDQLKLQQDHDKAEALLIAYYGKILAEKAGKPKRKRK